jgi:hypothetical protein
VELGTLVAKGAESASDAPAFDRDGKSKAVELDAEDTQTEHQKLA